MFFYKICFNFSAPEQDVSHVAFGSASCVLAFVVQPLNGALGLLLNAICIYVFCFKTHERALGQPLVPNLIALCCFDSVQLLLSFFVVNLPIVQQFIQTKFYFDIDRWYIINQMNVYSVRWLMPILMSVNYCSVWTMTAISVERFYAICHPFSSQLERMWLFTLLITASSISLNLVRYWEYSVVTFQFINDTRVMSVLRESDLHANESYDLVMNTLIYGALVYVVTIITIGLLNGRIVRRIWTARKTTRKYFQAKKATKNNHLRSTAMLLAIVVTFFVCQTGGIAHRLLFKDKVWILKNYMLYHFLSDMSNLLINLNCTLDPLLYFVFTRRFQDITKAPESRRRQASRALLWMQAQRSCPALGLSSTHRMELRPLMSQGDGQNRRRKRSRRWRLHRESTETTGICETAF